MTALVNAAMTEIYDYASGKETKPHFPSVDMLLRGVLKPIWLLVFTDYLDTRTLDRDVPMSETRTFFFASKAEAEAKVCDILYEEYFCEEDLDTLDEFQQDDEKYDFRYDLGCMLDVVSDKGEYVAKRLDYEIKECRLKDKDAVEGAVEGAVQEADEDEDDEDDEEDKDAEEVLHIPGKRKADNTDSESSNDKKPKAD